MEKNRYEKGRRFKERSFVRTLESLKGRPKAEDVAVAMSDEGSAPQVAVGGIREVRELLEKEPMRVHRILFKHYCTSYGTLRSIRNLDCLLTIYKHTT